MNWRKLILKKNFRRQTTYKISGTTTNLILQTRVFVNNRIVLVKNDEILNKGFGIFPVFNNYFVNITQDLGIFDWAEDTWDRSNVFSRMSGFRNNPTIQMIKHKYQNSFNFKFELVSTDEVIKFLDEIDCNRNSGL